MWHVLLQLSKQSWQHVLRLYMCGGFAVCIVQPTPRQSSVPLVPILCYMCQRPSYGYTTFVVYCCVKLVV